MTGPQASSGAPSAPPFPSRKAAERAAVTAFAVGTIAVTATFGARTAFYQPEYAMDADQLGLLGMQGAIEAFGALLLGALALWPKRRSVSTTLLLTFAIVLTLVKLFCMVALIALGEPEPWTYSTGVYLLAAVASGALMISFIPVATVVHAARTSGAHDGALRIRAAVCLWLALAGGSTLVLGPDLAARLLGAIAVLGALMHHAIGEAEERKLREWLRAALTQGPPAYFLEPEAPPHNVPSVYAGEARKATLLEAAEDGGSYRRDPTKKPIAALDPEAATRPRRFRERVIGISGLPVIFTLIAAAIGALTLYTNDLPPRAVSHLYDHYRVKRYSAYSIEGLSLWEIDRGGEYGGGPIVGYDPESRRVVQEQELFRRVRGVPLERLADLANGMLYNGVCCVLKGANPGWPMDRDGNEPEAPYVKDGKLVFWRKWRNQVDRFEVPVERGATNDPPR